MGKIKYGKLYGLLKNRNIKIKDLIHSTEHPDGILSPATLAKLSKNDYVNTSTIEKLCEYLDVQPGDIMEYIKDDEISSKKYPRFVW